MEDSGITDDIDFKRLLTDVSDWYDQRGYLSMLKVLYRELLVNIGELCAASRTIDIMNMLCSSGNLLSTDLTVLFDTMKATDTFGLEKKIPSCPNVRGIKIAKFTPHRQNVMKLGMVLMPGDIVRICGLYEKLQGRTFPDKWSFIMELEHQMIICESERKMVEFIDNLEQLGLPLAVKALNEGKSGKSKQLRKKGRLHKGIGEASVSKRPKLDKDRSGQMEQPQRSRADEDLIIKGSLMTRQKDLYQNENCMTPAIWHKGHKIDIAEIFTELKLLQSKKDKENKDKSTSTKKEGKPTSLPEALNVIKSTDSCKVLITGKGGMGKTTLLKYIAHQWATDDEHVLAGKLLFLINIREIKTKEKFLDVILNKIDSEDIIFKNNLSCNSVKRFLVTHDSEMVILLDGYDELETNAKDPIDLFKKCELRKSTVVITSRPDNTSDLVKYCDVHIEVMGFSPSNIKKYIQNHFHSISKIEIGNSLLKEFELDSVFWDDLYDRDTRYWDGKHKEAFQLCSSPLLLLQICTIWELKRVLPTYLPDLFKELICCILNQYLNRAGNKSVIANFERIPDEYISAILILGECMYEGLKKNILSIDKYILSNMAKNEELLNLALESGFVYEDTPVNPGDVREMYTPPHKLMSEALAGLYLSIEIQNGSSKVEYEEIRCNDYLNITRVFAIGFLGANAYKLLKPWLIMTVSNYCSIVQCLEHVKEEHEDYVLQQLDKQMSNDMEACSEQMWKSFRSLCLEYVKKSKQMSNSIAYSKQRWESFGGLLNDDISNIHLFKFIKICKTYGFVYNLEKAALCLMNRCREMQCQIVVHTLVLLEVIDQKYEPKPLIDCISKWKEKDISLLSAEMKKYHLKYNIASIKFYFKRSSAFLIHLLKYAKNLNSLVLWSLPSDKLVTGTILSAVINDLYNANIRLELQELNIQCNDLNDIDRTVLGKLFKIAPELTYLYVGNCRLLGGAILNTVINDFYNANTKLELHSLDIHGNDLSDIDGTLLGKLFKIAPKLAYLNVGNCRLLGGAIFNKVINDFYNANIKLKLLSLDIHGNDLSDIDGALLGILFKIAPKLMYLDVSECRLSGCILKAMITESQNRGSTVNNDKMKKLTFLKGSNICDITEKCGRMSTVLKDCILRLEGNNLSDIDGKSLTELLRVFHYCSYMHYPYMHYPGDNFFRWSDYSLTVDNLKQLVESVGENIILYWKTIDLNGINLSSVSGITLASLFKISQDLEHIDMSYCSISGRIVNEMLKECCRMNIVLKNITLNLQGNDLSDIDGNSLAELVKTVRLTIQPYLCFIWSGWYDDEDICFSWSDFSLTVDNLEKLVKSISESITLNWEKIDLSWINLSSVSGITLACLFKFSPELTYIDMSKCSLSGRIVNEMMEECSRMNLVLKFKKIDLMGNDLSDISGKTLACLFNSSQNLNHIDMSHCRLSGSIVNEMMEECCRMNLVLKDNMLFLKGNDISDIHDELLAELVRVINKCYNYDNKMFSWSDYFLTSDNLKKLFESVGEKDITLNLQILDLSRINLSSISSKTLARLFMVSPDMNHIDMSNCSLSGRIVNEMMEECCRMNVVLKDSMLSLKGNDLSDIDGKSFAELVRVICNPNIFRRHRYRHTLKDFTFTWSDYSLTVDNLEMLVESVGENITLIWELIDLSKINLSSISGITLAHLFKVSPELKHINMSNCNLSGSVINEMMEECCRMNLVLKYKKLDLMGNDLSGISGKTLACLFNSSQDLSHIDMSYCRLSGSTFNEMMVECCRILKYKKLDLMSNDLSDISGKTLACLVNNSQELNHIIMSHCRLSGSIVNEMMEECCRMNLVLKYKTFELMGNDLSDISGKTLACLFNISQDLDHIDISYCSLSGSIINEMMEECCRKNLVLEDNMLSLKGNDLSDIHDKLLSEFVRIIHKCYVIYNDKTFTWSDYSLTSDKLKNMVESVGEENITLKWQKIDLSRINLSSISSKTLARLFKISPDLNHIDMSICSLSGRIVNEMIEECCRMNVVLKDNMLRLKGNNLSDIDGKSLAKLVRVIDKKFDDDYDDELFSWSDYSLTVDNLEMLVESIGGNITFTWNRIDLSKINLSFINGITLARLLKASPELNHIDMSNCNLSGRIVNEMMEECCRMNVVLKENMLCLKGNDLSDTDGKSLLELG